MYIFFFFFLFLYFILCDKINEDELYFTGFPLNITIYEIDKLLSCSVLLKLKTEKDELNITNTLNKFNQSLKNKAERKILTDMFEICYNKIDNKTISKFFKNFIYIPNDEYLNEYDKFFDFINYDNYNENSNLVLSEEQNILSYKFDKVKEIYEQKENKKSYEMNKKIKIGNYDFSNIPFYLKGLIFIFGFGIFIFVILYFLNKLIKKENKMKKKKNK